MLSQQDVMMRAENIDDEVVVRAPVFVCPEYENALELEDKSPEAAIAIYQTLMATVANYADEDMSKVVEDAIYRLGSVYAKHGRLADLKALFVQMRPFFSHVAKARTAKITRTLIDQVADTPGATLDLQIEIVSDAITWCKNEKRTFLKQRMESKLASLLVESKKFKPALALISRVIKEVKKFDDKLLMVEIYLVESKTHLFLQNIAKSKGALTSARSAATSIYCPPLLQAQIDTMAGTLCAEEGDFKTSFSYFFEAFEGYNTINDPVRAVKCLKYMLMAKIMTKTPEDVLGIIKGKAGVKYAGRDVEAMKAVADAYKARSIEEFETAYTTYNVELKDDPIVARHLGDLKEALIEQNLVRLIEPFSRVEVSHVARLINLPLAQVEAKLSEMILDKKVNAILDQGAGVLVVFDDTQQDGTYEAGLETVKELSNAVDKLYARAQRVSQTSVR